MSVTFQKELFGSIMPELPELFYLHWSEVEDDQEAIPMDVDWAAYLRMEQNGFLHVLTARDGTKLIGYFLMVIRPSIHHAKTSLAASDLLYILPSYRKGRIGLDLIKKATEMARDLAAKKLYIPIKNRGPLPIILKRLGFAPSEVTYTKLL